MPLSRSKFDVCIKECEQNFCGRVIGIDAYPYKS